MGIQVSADRVARFVALIEREEGTLDELSQRLADGETLPEVCAAWDVPFSRVMAWLMAEPSRHARYMRSLEMAAHGLVAATVGIADEAVPEDVAVRKLRVDTRFRVAGKHARALYGDRLDVTADVSVSFGMALQAIAARRAARVLEHEPAQALPNDGEI